MNGIELLVTDHRKVDALFDQIEAETNFSKRKEIFSNIALELELHAHIEEKVLYPFFLVKEEFKEMVEEALDEHQEAKSLIREIRSTRDDNEFDNRVSELIKAVKHHVEEEENELFPKVRQVLSQEELEILGQKLEEAKQTPPENTLAA